MSPWWQGNTVKYVADICALIVVLWLKHTCDIRLSLQNNPIGFKEKKNHNTYLSFLSLQVFGGLVWILMASNHVAPPNPLGWVMFVSIFCFVMTFVWMIIFAAGVHKNSSGWAAAVRTGGRGNWMDEMNEQMCEWNRTLDFRVRWIGCGFFFLVFFYTCNPFIIYIYLCVQDFAYHGLAAFFYLSAAVILAYITFILGTAGTSKIYQIDIAAVVSTEVSMYTFGCHWFDYCFSSFTLKWLFQ